MSWQKEKERQNRFKKKKRDGWWVGEKDDTSKRRKQEDVKNEVEQTAEEEDCGRCILSGRIVLAFSQSELKSL